MQNNVKNPYIVCVISGSVYEMLYYSKFCIKVIYIFRIQEQLQGISNNQQTHIIVVYDLNLENVDL